MIRKLHLFLLSILTFLSVQAVFIDTASAGSVTVNGEDYISGDIYGDVTGEGPLGHCERVSRYTDGGHIGNATMSGTVSFTLETTQIDHPLAWTGFTLSIKASPSYESGVLVLAFGPDHGATVSMWNYTTQAWDEVGTSSSHYTPTDVAEISVTDAYNYVQDLGDDQYRMIVKMYWMRTANDINHANRYDIATVGASWSLNSECDLAVSEVSFGPASLRPGAHPTQASFDLTNYGPRTLVSPNTRIKSEFYISLDPNPSAPGRVKIGEYLFDAELGHGESDTITLDSTALNQLTIPSDADGDYYVFAAAYHASPSTFIDPDNSDNIEAASGTVEVAPFVISGTILDSQSDPVSGVTMTGLPSSPVTDVNGDYSDTVPYEWSGTVTPEKTGWNFDPTSRTYSSVTSDQSSQSYTGTSLPVISGSVKNSTGTGISGVTMTGLPSSPVTDSQGAYSDTVPVGWSGTVTPEKTGCTFDPASRTYSSVTSSQTSQNYTVSDVTISGRVEDEGSNPVAGVTITGLPDSPVTDAGGDYSASVPYGWSGTARPQKEGCAFTPATRAYSSVTSDQTDQNYTLSGYIISGCVELSGGQGVVNVTISGLPGSPVTDENGDYSATVPVGWSGTATPEKSGCTFTPTSRTYTDVSNGQSDQDYTAVCLGDLNSDGDMNETDADLVLQYLFGERADLDTAIKDLAEEIGLPSDPPDVRVALWILKNIE